MRIIYCMHCALVHCALACIIFILRALSQLFYWVALACQHTSTLAVLGKVNMELAITDQTEIKQKY